MNLTFKLILALSMCFSLSAFSQNRKPIDVVKLANEIESCTTLDTTKYGRLKILDSLLELQRYHFELLSYKAKYELALTSTNKEERVILYKRIRNFPFYTVHVPYYGHEFADLYAYSTRNLIFEYRGNKEALLNLDIVPSMRDRLYGFLRMELEFIGETWDKGEIPVPPGLLESIKKSSGN